MKRVDYIDVLKGIGILLVIIGHHLLEVNPIIAWINSFHMPMFFFVSGYLWKNKQSTIELVKNKAKSLLYPYFTLSAIVMVFHFFWYNIIFTKSVPETTTLKVLVLTISTFGYHAFWFIPCLFLSCLLFFFFSKTRSRKIMFIGLVIAIVLIHTFYGEQIKLFVPYIYKYIFRAIVATSFVFLGNEFKNIDDIMSKSRQNLVWCASFIVSLFGIILMIVNKDYAVTNLSVANIDNIVLFYITSISNTLFIYYTCKNIQVPFKKFFTYMGRNSILILAFHMDISIEIAWMLLGLIKIPCNITVLSIIAIVLEIIILLVLILFTNKFFPWLTVFPEGKKLPIAMENKT